ncbi:hypothetical protein AGMMS50229_20550 [Campylobacterota bacterium]|nr:hypothetical protein AGMMS50229_20550 [Campylobacterota bacterium]
MSKKERFSSQAVADAPPFDVEDATDWGTVMVADTEDTLDEENNEDIPAPVLDELSSDFISSWNRLVSMTNWEKGKLIHNWRTKLMERDLPRHVYSDEAWAKRVGNVSGQHIGRLRRVYERFGESVSNYPQLFWSHFQAALDWEDAEKWLLDASDNQWSVATMRLNRWEASGAPPNQKPTDDIPMTDLDEDVNPYNDSEAAVKPTDKPKDKKKNRDSDDEDGSMGKKGGKSNDEDNLGEFSTPAEAFAQMKQMKDLPEDLKDAFEQLKVVVLSHKISGWREVDPQRIVTFLSAMKVVVLTEEK